MRNITLKFYAFRVLVVSCYDYDDIRHSFMFTENLWYETFLYESQDNKSFKYPKINFWIKYYE